MNHHNNGDEGFMHLVKGMVLGVIVFFYKLWNGFIDHNGGYEEMFYSLVTLIVFGFIGAGVSFLATKFYKWMWK